MTNASKASISRAAWFETLLATVTAGCLLAQYTRSTGGPVGPWLALLWGMSAALVAARTATSFRLWISLALANLAISSWVADATALATLWLPLLTAASLRWLEGRSAETAVPAAEAPIAPLIVDAVNDDDRQHTIEWSQVQDRASAKTVSGVARLTFRPGERQTELHLAFCPSFAATPVFHVEQTGGPQVRVKTTQVMPYGARLEVQRAEAAAWCVVTLEFAATPAASDAAPVRRAS